MSTPPDSLELAVAYMRVIFLALPFLYLYAFVMAVLRGAGDSKTPFYFMLLSVGIDIALNPVFIFGLGPAPRLGIAGSALATFIAQAVSLAALIRHLYRRHHVLCLHREELKLLKIDWAVAATLVRKGIPMSAQMLVMSLSGVLMITLVNRFGVDTTAAFGAALQIWNYIQMPAFAVGMALSAMTAQNVGARKWHRVTRIARVGVLYSVILTGSIVLAIELLDQRIFALFLPAASAALTVASHMNRIVTPSFIFFGVSVALFGVVRATGAAVPRALPGGRSVVELSVVLAPLVHPGAALLPLRRLARRAHAAGRNLSAVLSPIAYAQAPQQRCTMRARAVPNEGESTYADAQARPQRPHGFGARSWLHGHERVLRCAQRRRIDRDAE